MSGGGGAGRGEGSRPEARPHPGPLLLYCSLPLIVLPTLLLSLLRYVLCPGCKSVDTLLDRDSATRLMHLRCQQCGASRTVSAIKSGFVARVTKRQQAPG